jgi:hypothetical protein
MGLFKNIMKKKPGGTLVGNLVRGVANNLSGGVIGSGVNRLPTEVSNGANLTAQNQMKVLQETAGKGLADSPLINGFTNQVANNSTKQVLRKYWYILAIPVIGIPVLVWLIMRKKPQRRRYY